MRRFVDGDPIEATAWIAVRPAARSVRPLAALATIVVVLAAGSVAVVLDSLGLLVVVTPAAGYLTWQAARRLLATRAITPIRTQTAPLPATTVATLVARGSATVRGTTYVAVQDARHVVLSTVVGGGRIELPPASIVGMGGGGP